MANTITINVLGDTRNFKSALSGVQNDLGKLGTASQKAGSFLKNSLKVAAGGAVVAGVAIAKFGHDSITAASDLNETISKTKTIFGAASPEIMKFASNAATALGQSKQEALDGVSTFGNFFNQIGIGTKKSAEMSKGFVTMASDLASFNNAAPVDVMDALSSATRGEYDALQKYIPTINAAAVQNKAMAMTGKESASALTDSEKATALYALALKGQGKAQGDFARTSGGLANQQRILAAQFENVKAKVGQALLPVMTKLIGVIVKEGIPILNQFSDWFAKNGPSAIDSTIKALTPFVKALINIGKFVAQNAKAIAILVAAFYSIVTVVAAVNKAVALYKATAAAIRAVTIAWKSAQLALNIVMAANPIGVVVVAIVALIAIFVLAYKKSETFRNIVNASWNAIKAATSAVFGWMKTFIKGVWDAISKTVTTVVNAVKDGVTKAWNKIKSVTSTVWNWIKSHMKTIMAAVLIAVTGPVGLIVVAIVKNWDKIKSVTTKVWNAIKSVTSKVWDGIKAVINKVVDFIRGLITREFNGWKKIITTVWNAVKSITSKTWNAIKSAISSAINAAKHVVTSVTSAIKSAISRAWSAAKSATVSMWNGIKNAVQNAVQGLMNIVRSIHGKITGAFSGAGSWLLSVGRNVVQGLINGIKAMAGSAARAALDVVKGAINAAKGALHIGSPSKLFRQFGKWTVEGLVIGLDEKAGTAAQASGRLAKKVAEGFSAPKMTLNSKTALAGGMAGGHQVQINVSVPPTANPAATGREIQKALDEYYRTGGVRRA